MVVGSDPFDQDEVRGRSGSELFVDGLLEIGTVDFGVVKDDDFGAKGVLTFPDGRLEDALDRRQKGLDFGLLFVRA